MKNWNDITLKQFYSIKELLQLNDDYTFLNLIDLIYGVDSANLPLTELSKYNGAIDFLSEEIPTVEVKKQYTISGVIYNSNFDITTITTSQFIDYQNYLKEENPRYEKLLSVFFIPDGHKYNDGYNVREVQKDLLELDIPTVMSISFFFRKQLTLFAETFLLYLAESVQKMKIPKEQKQQLIEAIQQVDCSSLDSFPSFLSTVKKQTQA